MAKAKIRLELDLAVVEEAIALEVRPAVAEFLATRYDIKAMITEELARDNSPSADTAYAQHSLMMMYALGGSASPSGKPLIEALVRQGIKDAAMAYIKTTIEERGPALDAAFKRMMRDTPDRLVNAFADMIDGAELELDLSATLAVKPPEPDYDRC